MPFGGLGQASYEVRPQISPKSPPQVPSCGRGVLGRVLLAGSCPEEAGTASPTVRQVGGQDQQQLGGRL